MRGENFTPLVFLSFQNTMYIWRTIPWCGARQCSARSPGVRRTPLHHNIFKIVMLVFVICGDLCCNNLIFRYMCDIIHTSVETLTFWHKNYLFRGGKYDFKKRCDLLEKERICFIFAEHSCPFHSFVFCSGYRQWQFNRCR